MTSAPVHEDEEITLEIVRFLAWLKKRGRSVKLKICHLKWDPKDIPIEDICRKSARGRMHVRRNPSTGDKWVVLDDLVWADNLMIDYGEEVPHHRHWKEL
ncbi:MAG: hypothetical protein STSR0009_31200 [Methanoregula sp.]